MLKKSLCALFQSSKSSVFLRFSYIVARTRRALQLPSASRARNGDILTPLSLRLRWELRVHMCVAESEK